MSSALTPPATITFDCYGTLLDTSPFHELLAKTGVKAGIQPDLAVETFTSWEDRLMYGDPYQDYDRLLQEVLAWCDRQLNTAVFVPLLEQALEIHRHFRPFPDVIPALRKLKEAGFRICLMSNTTADLMDSHLQTLAQLPDAWLTADSTECFKPDLRFFRQAEETFELCRHPHIHVAKGYWWDIVPAARLGWNRIWVNRSAEPAPRRQEEPVTVIRDLSTLPALLSGTSPDQWVTGTACG